MKKPHGDLVDALGHLIDEPRVRRVLHIYAERSPAVLRLVVACLELMTDVSPAPMASAAAGALREVVYQDCGLYLLCAEWCRAHASEDNATTKALREQLLVALLRSLPPECQRLVSARRPPGRGVLTHLCFSQIVERVPGRELAALGVTNVPSPAGVARLG